MPSLLQTLKIGTLTVAVALAGCTTTPDDHHHDGDHADADHGGSDTLPYTGDEEVQWTITAGQPEEFRFDPDSFAVHEGQSVGVTFRNQGETAHEISIPDLDFHLHAEPGDTMQGAFVASDPTTYTFGCYIPGHFEAGMKGSLEVDA